MSRKKIIRRFQIVFGVLVDEVQFQCSIIIHYTPIFARILGDTSAEIPT